MNLPSFIEEKIRRIEELHRRLDITLTTNSVLLKRRVRDWTANDTFGVFNRSGVWKTIPAKGLHSLNIVKPTVKTTAAAIMTAEVKVTIEPRFVKDQTAELAAQVARTIADLKTSEQWTPQLHATVATEPQVAPGVFLLVEWNPYANSTYSVEEWGDDEMMTGGMSVCKECGYEEEGEQEMCAHCGGGMEMTEQPEASSMSVVKDIKTYTAGDTRTRIVPACEMLIDGRDTQGGNLMAARYALHRTLIPVTEITAEYPNAPTATSEWSMPLRWKFALDTGQDMLLDNEPSDELIERKDLYITPQFYGEDPLDEGFRLENDDGSIRFEAFAGKMLSESEFNGKAFDEPPVLCVRTIGNKIIDIFPYDFREKFIYINFLPNTSGFYGLFLTEMIPMQDAVNHMLTIQMRHTARNARTTKVLNSGSYDPEDADKDVVLTKDPLPYDMPISNTYGHMPVSTLSTAPMDLIGLMLSTMGQVSGVTGAMQGVSSPNEPYAAQRMQKEQSMGQLTPFMRSIANAKVAWVKRQLKECQENWPEEHFEFIKRINPDWDDAYIDAFLNANLDTDIIVDYEPGSESPRNLLDRELALRQFMQDVMMLAQLNPALLEGDITNEILLRLKQFGQIDVDVQNTEAEIRISDSRLDKIQALIKDFPIHPGTPPEAIKIMANTMIASIPDLQPSQYEDPTSQVEFYRDRLNQELAQRDPNFFLIACIETMIQMHEDVTVERAQRDAEMQMEAQEPMIEQQQQMAQEQQMQAMQAEEAAKEADHVRELEKQAMSDDTDVYSITAGQ